VPCKKIAPPQKPHPFPFPKKLEWPKEKLPLHYNIPPTPTTITALASLAPLPLSPELKSKNVLLLVPNLLVRREARPLEHDRWSALEDEKVVARFEEILLEEFKRYESGGSVPLNRRPGENVRDLEAVRVIRSPFIERVAAKEVVHVVARENQGDLSVIRWVTEDLVNDLVARRDAGSSCNHVESVVNGGLAYRIARCMIEGR